MYPRPRSSRRHGKNGRTNPLNFVYAFFGIIILLYLIFLANTLSPKSSGAKETTATTDLKASATNLREGGGNQAASRSWKFNPDRKYVWLEVSFDDVVIGKVTAELYSDIVPKTTENFRVLVTGERKDEGLSYDNCVCHRIIKDFVVQCGDFETGKGYGGRSIYGRKFDDEPAGLLLKHSKRYILQMANSGPNSNGSQFCFMLAAMPHLNTKHVVFGEVVDGFEIVDKMETAAGGAHKVVLVRGGQYLQ